MYFRPPQGLRGSSKNKFHNKQTLGRHDPPPPPRTLLSSFMTHLGMCTLDWLITAFPVSTISSKAPYRVVSLKWVLHSEETVKPQE